MAEPTLLFSIGATKAGTSWLFDYLEGHPECHVRSLKELHYFDTLDNDRLPKQIMAGERGLARMQRRVTRDPNKNQEYRSRNIADREEWLSVLRKGKEDIEAYRSYLMGGRTDDQKIIADVTPAYSLLSADRLRAMAKICRDTRFLYILRDPVERLWSHVRMIASRRDKNGLVTADRAGNILARAIRGSEPEIIVRGDYQSAMDKLKEAVSPEKYMVCFYEELFGGEALGQICQFLGIDAAEGAKDRRVHAGQPLAMTEEQRAEARAFLKPQYDHIAFRMGRIPAAWSAEGASA